MKILKINLKSLYSTNWTKKIAKKYATNLSKNQSGIITSMIYRSKKTYLYIIVANLILTAAIMLTQAGKGESKVAKFVLDNFYNQNDSNDFFAVNAPNGYSYGNREGDVSINDQYGGIQVRVPDETMYPSKFSLISWLDRVMHSPDFESGFTKYLSQSFDSLPFEVQSLFIHSGVVDTSESSTNELYFYFKVNLGANYYVFVKTSDFATYEINPLSGGIVPESEIALIENSLTSFAKDPNNQEIMSKLLSEYESFSEINSEISEVRENLGGTQ